MRSSSVAIILAVVSAAMVSEGQTGRAHRRAAAQEPPASQQRFIFADIELHGWRQISGNLVSTVSAEGPNTTVDSTDRTGAKSRLQAPRLTAHLNEKTRQVARIEAQGGVRFSGERPAPSGKGKQTVQGTGSKGTYYKEQGRLVLEGPVTYYGEQPTETGKQWIRGTAASAVYDENKRTLTLTGGVKAKLMAENMREPADIISDQAVVDMSKPQFDFILTNKDDTGGKVIFRQQQPAPAGEGKP